MVSSSRVPIAIVGMGGVFPGAPSVAALWDVVREGRDVTQDVPAERWVLPPEQALAPGDAKPDRVYAGRAGLLAPFEVDRAKLDLLPSELRALDPAVHVLLLAATEAWSATVTEPIDRRRAAVVLGNIVLPTDGASALSQWVVGRELERQVLGEKASSPEAAPSAWNRWVAGLPAGVLARALGLGGDHFTLDAACASSLFAIQLAAAKLQRHEVDVALTGGLSRPSSLYTQMGFSQLGALSPRGRCSPFDTRADGLVVGEGAGVLVLKRLDDALRHGDRVWALVRGVGVSNDVDGRLLAPSCEGQLRAMRSAYRQTGWIPGDVELVECHATGTPVGDAVEFESVRTLRGQAQGHAGPSFLGATKANVGHLLTAAGAVATIKAVLAMEHGTIPPVANFAAPGAKITLADSGLRVPTQATDWPDTGRPRRAAVSGFGFGGTNAHVLLERFDRQLPTPSGATSRSSAAGGRRPEPEPEPETQTTGIRVAVVGLGAHVGPWQGVHEVREQLFGTAEVARECKDGRDPELQAQGWLIDALELPVGRFRIPPAELQELLPQQLLLLQVAQDAAEDVRGSRPSGERCGVFAGVELDFGTTDYHLRWVVRSRAPRWASRLGRPDSGPEFEAWVERLCDALGPPLNANRTMGGLASVAASRVARELGFGGPSYTLSSEESSGLVALETAARALRRGEVDFALAGAVGLGADVRAWLGRSAHEGSAAEETPSEGAVVVALKRLEDAEREGDRIYAVLEGAAAASSGGALLTTPSQAAVGTSLTEALAEAAVEPGALDGLELATGPGSVGYGALSRALDEASVVTSQLSATARLGHAGSASALVGVLAAVLRLHHQVLDRPVAPGDDRCRTGQPRRWVHDTVRGPRTMAVGSCSATGHAAHAVLRGYEAHDRLWHPPATEALFVIEADSKDGLRRRLERLLAVAMDRAGARSDGPDPSSTIDAESPASRPAGGAESGDEALREVLAVATGWWAEQGSSPDAGLGLSIVTTSIAELQRTVHELLDDLRDGETLRSRPEGRVMFSPTPLGGEVAFVFPGSGSHFPGMGRRLALEVPAVLDQQSQRHDTLASQLRPELCWDRPAAAMNDDARGLILAQVTLGTLSSDALRELGVQPQAVIGYSLGETAGLFSLGAWEGRAAMLERVAASPLFASQLTGPCDAARATWGLADDESVQWTLGVVDATAAQVDAALADEARVYRLIVNTPGACVIGGQRDDVLRVVQRLGAEFHPLDGVTTVHCEVVRAVEDAYRALHVLPTTAPAGVRFYSGAWGRAYPVDADSAAGSVTAQAVEGLDYPAVIRRAHDDGVRVFVELGPGRSCTRMIQEILGDRPHFAMAVCSSGLEGRSALVRAAAWMVAHRVPVRWNSLVEPDGFCRGRSTSPATPDRGSAVVRVRVGRPALGAVPPFLSATPSPTPLAEPDVSPTCARGPTEPAPPRQPPRLRPGPPASATSKASLASASSSRSPMTESAPILVRSSASPSPTPARDRTPAWFAPVRAASDAHAAFLATQAATMEAAVAELRRQQALVERGADPARSAVSRTLEPRASDPTAGPQNPGSEAHVAAHWTAAEPPRSLDRAACLTFATGAIGDALGPSFAEIDRHPTRVRLPAEPLMLVDRIIDIEGEPRSMSSGRVVTEHDVLADKWYLDAGRIPTCVAVEAGQADLFLSAFLGVDFETRGLAVYRLLDATVTFHGRLPAVGSTIHYDIRIERFFRQGDTWLFRFGFDATVDGEPLMTMRDGCAGFFSEAALAAGKGVVDGSLARGALRERSALSERPQFVSPSVRTLDASALQALRSGDLVAAFGAAYQGLPLTRPLTLPGAPMNLVHRITELDRDGGAFGLGRVVGEADIHPDDWFITCHFVDDPVMPGTLMYECCLHTLRVFLLSLGWVGDEGASFEPVLGVESRLKCRGQVLGHTSVVTYEITMRRFGADPEPYVICDATMYADGKRIVDIEDMSARLCGTDVESLRAMWSQLTRPSSPSPRGRYDKASLEAFAYGAPSDAFGAPYRVFDGPQRSIARLPGAPFQFIDRVVAVQGEPFVMQAGASCVAEVDRQTWAWTLDANRQADPAFAVLLEIGLQACGWLAAYVGSALTSDRNLHFRNLGGKATLTRAITPDDATLVMRAAMTKVASSGDMIIQHFDFSVESAAGEMIYEGTTYFGFFTTAALADQKGLRDQDLYVPTPAERQRALAPRPVSTEAPMPTERWRMIEELECIVPEGGRHGRGFLQGAIDVDPQLWFFSAHFHEDPVWPGSLGLEAFIQLLKSYAIEVFELGPQARFSTTPVGHEHRWEYRGQVVPSCSRVVVQAHIVRVCADTRTVVADGLLSVDGRPIYSMESFAMEVRA